MISSQKSETIHIYYEPPLKVKRNADNEEIMYTPETSVLIYKCGVRGGLN